MSQRPFLRRLHRIIYGFLAFTLIYLAAHSIGLVPIPTWSAQRFNLTSGQISTGLGLLWRIPDWQPGFEIDPQKEWVVKVGWRNEDSQIVFRIVDCKGTVTTYIKFDREMAYLSTKAVKQNSVDKLAQQLNNMKLMNLYGKYYALPDQRRYVLQIKSGKHTKQVLSVDHLPREFREVHDAVCRLINEDDLGWSEIVPSDSEAFQAHLQHIACESLVDALSGP